MCLLHGLQDRNLLPALCPLFSLFLAVLLCACLWSYLSSGHTSCAGLSYGKLPINLLHWPRIHLTSFFVLAPRAYVLDFFPWPDLSPTLPVFRVTTDFTAVRSLLWMLISVLCRERAHAFTKYCIVCVFPADYHKHTTLQSGRNYVRGHCYVWTDSAPRMYAV